MGNSLLDFVMALVRDQGAAARYAADPAGMLADANLTGVTIADVNNLIPVVTDSLASATPGFGALADSANVWTSNAAAVAFDAFHVEVPAGVFPPVSPGPVFPGPDLSAPVIQDQSPVAVPDDSPIFPDTPVHQPVDQVDSTWVEDRAGGDDSALDGVGHSHVDPVVEHHPGDDAGFDLF